ncbi:sugar kinase [Actinokineospora bangkokensis]|uniref:Sugar kinase n=2 Tax=Actinokineospora bangkokensis TaxID=1193682 RepID=A0A1Q9LL18_9PSEU|nr:sugar kinase [Actinokineospora bangkokensis]
MALLTVPASGVATGPPVLGVGGAESNVAIAVARLGGRATWVSRVGDDALGRAVTREVRAEGVDVRAPLDPGAPTGLMVKEVRGGHPSAVRYYRAGSAASRLSESDVDPELVAAADVLHLTGITPALGPGPLRAVERAIALARAAGVPVSFDVNHRRTLWADSRAAPVLARLVASADLVFAGVEEAELVLGRGGTDEELAAGLTALGPATAVLKLGERGALAHADGRFVPAPTTPVRVVDPVGAGDGFVGGYLAELVLGEPVERCLATANAVGGYACTVPGDWEGLPTRADLAAAARSGEVHR